MAPDSHPIRFNRPFLFGNEIEYVSQAVANGHLSTGGSFTTRVSEVLNQFHDSYSVLLTSSCTDALEMSAMLLNLKDGDEIILPSYTFSSTATAFARQQANLIFADIEPTTLGISRRTVEPLLTKRTKAIVGVNYAGVSCDGQGIKDLCDLNGIIFIEDNAHGLFGRSDVQPLGAFGSLSTLSFHETKNFTCGEGGALVINSEQFVERAQILLDKGTNRKQFFEGLVDKYTWVDHGSSFGMSELSSAFLFGQLEMRETVMNRRRSLHRMYRDLLDEWASDHGVLLPFEVTSDTPADHMFYVVLPPSIDRGQLIRRMNSHSIYPAFHYVPVHSSPAGLRFASRYHDCPITDDLSARLLRLPFYVGLTSHDVSRVVEALKTALLNVST